MKEYLRKLVVTILTLEAKLVVKKYKPHIVLVTGSVGKTSTKDATYTALSSHFFVRRSEKSFNSDIGAPLTVLGIPNGWSNPVRWLRNIIDGLFLIILNAPYPKWLIVEVGADRPGDITTSLSWLRPEVVIATRFPAISVHVEFYDSPDEVQQEELAPLSWLKPGGVAVVNNDDEVVGPAALPDGVERVSFGLSEHADVRASRMHINATKGMATGISFDITYKKERAHIALKDVVGLQHVYAVLGGVAAGLAVGVPLEKMATVLHEHVGAKSRMRLIDGVHGSLLIDDSYNSSPVAVQQALTTLEEMPHPEREGARVGRNIAVLGDMLELGSYSVAEHEKVGKGVGGFADMVVTVGVRARGIAHGAIKAGMSEDSVLQFDRALDAAEHLKNVVQKGDVILIKGSQSMRMEKIVTELMDEPRDASKLVCRQDPEWLAR